MGKKLKTNAKAEAARDRKAQTQNEKKAKAQKAAEDAKWEDKGVPKKMKNAQARKEDDAKKKEEADRKRAEKAALRAAEEKELASMKKGKTAAKPAKKTAAELAAQAKKDQEEAKRAREEKKRQQVAQLDFEAIAAENQAIREQRAKDEELYGAENIVETVGLDAALDSLSVGGGADRHPERRRKAAYKAYEEQHLPQLRADNPGLKLSQVKQLLFKQWQSAPENPMNQAGPSS